ncbi:MAG: hypothetical protein ACRDJ3_08270 [Solirubrobacteraceae bacterium]
MAAAPPQEIERWMLFERENEPSVIVLVVDDGADDEITARVASEGNVPSEHFGGVWGTGQRDGAWLLAFQMIELGGGVERRWFTDNIHRELLEAILEVPHYVAVMPSEIAGDARTLEDALPRLGGALFVQVDHRSPQVEQVLAERGDG